VSSQKKTQYIVVKNQSKLAVSPVNGLSNANRTLPSSSSPDPSVIRLIFFCDPGMPYGIIRLRGPISLQTRFAKPNEISLYFGTPISLNHTPVKQEEKMVSRCEDTNKTKNRTLLRLHDGVRNIWLAGLACFIGLLPGFL
jgi:hypothetical protein